MWNFVFRGESSPHLELDIYDPIGDSFFSSGITAKDVRRKLQQAGDAKSIRVRINSAGGDVIDGFAIYNLLAEHPGRVEVDIDGLAGSMASVVAMAGKEIRIASAAFVMVHNPWGGVIGKADDLREHADLLDKMRDNIADVYARRTGLARAEVLALMEAETWMNADEAKAKRFVDKVKPGAGDTRALAAVDAGAYRNMPPSLRSAVEQARLECSIPSPAIGERRYEQLHGAELARLERTDPAKHQALRADWLRRGEPDFTGSATVSRETIAAWDAADAEASKAPAVTHNGRRYEQLPGPALAQLEHDDPETFRRLRADWVRRGEPAFDVAS